jgi:hypothetical protein
MNSPFPFLCKTSSLRSLPFALRTVSPFGVALALAASGCATLSPPPAAATLERARNASSYSGSLRVSLKGPGVRARSRALVAFERPASLRIEIPGPTGLLLVAVVRDDVLTAVFPREKAVFQGGAGAADLEALLGLALAPAEVMDLLLGAPSPRLRDYRARWGASLPSKIQATLPDGARLAVTVDDAGTGVSLGPAVFAAPPHVGYRTVEAAEARRLWGAR